MESKLVKSEKSTESISFYFKENQQYYIVVEYSVEEFKDFFDSTKTDSIISFFDDRKKESDDIQKNSSIIICVKVDNLKKEFRELNNQIMKIEEDEYFFKKYVILYTENSVRDLKTKDNIVATLQDRLSNITNFDQFQENNFFNDEYFLVVQLFVKLPFLTIEKSDSDFQSIEEKLLKAILADSNQNLNKKLLSEDKDKLDKLLDSFLSEDENSDINNFLKTLEEL